MIQLSVEIQLFRHELLPDNNSNTRKKRVHLRKPYRETPMKPDDFYSHVRRRLRGSRRMQVEHGFGVAGLNGAAFF
jgi:hypothetical protein